MSYISQEVKTVAFCTEGMARDLLFIPVEMAPGHLIDMREIQAAIKQLYTLQFVCVEILTSHIAFIEISYSVLRTIPRKQTAR
jgi:hypothetical protein